MSHKKYIKAATSVNSEMLAFYWSLGRDIVTMNAESKYGSSFFDKLSSDLKSIIPAAKCFSPTNLRFMKRFYKLVSELSEKLPQSGAESGLSSETIPALASSEKLPQVGAELLTIPWGHPMSSSVMDEMLYYLRFRDDSYIQSRLEDTKLWSCQCHNTFDGEYGYGKTGWMSERFCHSEGLLTEKWPDRSPASTWLALMPWACGSILEGLNGKVWDMI